MPNPEGLPQGAHATLFSTILEVWGSRKGFQGPGAKVGTSGGGLAAPLTHLGKDFLLEWMA